LGVAVSFTQVNVSKRIHAKLSFADATT